MSLEETERGGVGALILSHWREKQIYNVGQRSPDFDVTRSKMANRDLTWRNSATSDWIKSSNSFLWKRES